VKSFCCLSTKESLIARGKKRVREDQQVRGAIERLKNLRGELMFYFYNLTGKGAKRQVCSAIGTDLTAYFQDKKGQAFQNACPARFSSRFATV
jgi:hypothetical protein